MATIEDAAYVAGLFDGDGSMSISNASKHFGHMRLVIANKHKPTLDWVGQIYKGVVVQHDMSTSLKPDGILWRWQLTKSVDVLQCITEILPHSKVRKADLYAALQFIKGGL